MKIRSQLKGGIYDVSFRYNTNLGGYATLMSDIPKLGEKEDILACLFYASETLENTTFMPLVEAV